MITCVMALLLLTACSPFHSKTSLTPEQIAAISRPSTALAAGRNCPRIEADDRAISEEYDAIGVQAAKKADYRVAKSAAVREAESEFHKDRLGFCASAWAAYGENGTYPRRMLARKKPVIRAHDWRNSRRFILPLHADGAD